MNDFKWAICVIVVFAGTVMLCKAVDAFSDDLVGIAVTGITEFFKSFFK